MQHAILDQAKMRYFSSPWDNIDSTYGLLQWQI